MTDCVAIVSGGMDSITLLHYLVKHLNKQPAVLTFIYGQKNSREIAYAQHHTAALNIGDHRILDVGVFAPLLASSALISDDVPLPDIDEARQQGQPSTYVPNRNMIFLALAAAYAETLGVQDVFYGAQKQDAYSYWDTTPQFLAQLNAVYALNPQTPVRIHAPFVGYSKADVLRTGLELNVDYGQTWSCYAGGDVACGTCPTCVERLNAFREVSIPDPLTYATAGKA